MCLWGGELAVFSNKEKPELLFHYIISSISSHFCLFAEDFLFFPIFQRGSGDAWYFLIMVVDLDGKRFTYRENKVDHHRYKPKENLNWYPLDCINNSTQWFVE